MKVQQLDHLNLTVQNLDETIAWYGRVFGFELVERAIQDGTHWGVIRSEDAMLCIYEAPDREHLDGNKLRERGLHGLSHFGLRITDRAAWEQTVEREGLELLYGGLIEWPHSLAWYVADPTGHEIEIALWNEDTVRFGAS